MTPEAKVKKEIRRLANEHGVLLYAHVMTGYGHHSQPDFTGCLCGRYIAIEAKATANSKATTLQLYELMRVIEHGGIAMIIHQDNLHELQEFFASYNRLVVADSPPEKYLGVNELTPLIDRFHAHITNLFSRSQSVASLGVVQPRVKRGRNQ